MHLKAAFRAQVIIVKTVAIAAFSCAAWAPPAFSETISEAVRRAVLNNNARKAAIASIEAQGNQVGIAQGARAPSIALFGEAAAETVDDPSSLSLADNDDLKLARQLSLGVEFPLLDGMRSLNAVYREATLLDAEIIRLSDETETLALNAVQAYIDVARHRRVVALADRNIRVHQRIRGQVEQQVVGGSLPEADLLSADDKVFEARLAKAEAEAALGNALSSFQFVVGTPPRGALSLTSNGVLPRSVAAAEAAAVANSFRLKVAQKEIEALTYKGKIDDAEWRPKVSLFAGAEVGHDLDGSSGHEETLRAGVRLNWTLHQGKKRAATAARNHDLVMRAHYRKKQMEGEVRDFVRRSWNTYRTSAERRGLLTRSVENSTQIAAAYSRDFEAAKRPLLQVLDAERDLFNLKVQLINAEAATAFQSYRVLAAQNTLARHFGLSAANRALIPNYEARVKAEPRKGFDISTPDLQ
ncbi:TolC family protein [Ovoidimarina sediminis]|uniref:TolC family protein n=1 Tax=Ovoidimarina sediminis TaxID=3079856 RepID=UPI002906E450|nr:TolC family protein [Rhodophyticola sp. MJ-SS7]MDU8946660.1 TolC family protein [Rhodophyticola sp. MJ-SS7]